MYHPTAYERAMDHPAYRALEDQYDLATARATTAGDVIAMLPVIADRGWVVTRVGWIRSRDVRPNTTEPDNPLCALAADVQPDLPFPMTSNAAGLILNLSRWVWVDLLHGEVDPRHPLHARIAAALNTTHERPHDV